MIKSGFRQLHFSNGNIGNIRKAAKNSTLFKNNKMVFLSFFLHTTMYNNHSIPSCKKTRKKKRGNGSLFIFCV